MAPLEYARTHRNRFLDELITFLRIPSISTLPEHAEHVAQAAHWLADHLRGLGLPEVEVVPTDGHPVVYAQWLGAGAEAPTVLIYGHYDVQPVDPLDEWHTPPFEPTLRDDNLYARGASDDKGQLFIHLKAIEAYLREEGRLPVNVKLLLEGEEECGSPNLAPVIEEHAERLQADVALISDTHILGPDQPSIVYSLRGLSYIEITVQGPAHDLHSGMYGGAVDNPLHVLARLIASLHDDAGRVTVPGFYDDVLPLTEEERAELARIPYGEEELLADTGVPRAWGEPEYTVVERIGARPTLDVNGLWGGFTGEGAKTVIPARAHAKISMRLVPNQDPDRVAQAALAYLQRAAPPTVTVTGRIFHGTPPALVPQDHPAMRAAAAAYERVWGRRPIFTREGGSIPVVALFAERLRLPTVLMGFGLRDDNLHAPNEKFYLPNFYRGIETAVHFFHLLPEHMG